MEAVEAVGRDIGLDEAMAIEMPSNNFASFFGAALQAYSERFLSLSIARRSFFVGRPAPWSRFATASVRCFGWGGLRSR